MKPISKKFPQDIVHKMKYYYQNDLKETPSHALFQARTPNAVITAYKSGKVVFQGANPSLEADRWKTNEWKEQPSKKAKKKKGKSPVILPEGFFTKSHIGSDESGTGDYFGPITTCAVYVQENQIALLKEIGIQDSKVISDIKIKELSKTLIDMNIPYSLMILHNEKYNALQKRGWSQGKMKAMLHDSCIKSLLKKIENASYEGILIDQFCEPELYKRHLASEGKKVDDHTYFMTEAESYSIAVAAGSVIARASFVHEMEKLSKLVGVTLLKGASNRVDQTIAQIIQTHGEQILEKLAKVHFANTKKARRYLSL